MVVVVDESVGQAWGSSLAPTDLGLLPLNLLPSFLSTVTIPCGLFSCPGFLSSLCGFFFFLSSPRLNVPVVSAPETESILRSRNQTAELSLSPDVGGHTDAEPSGYLTPREWPCRVISLTLGA